MHESENVAGCPLASLSVFQLLTAVGCSLGCVPSACVGWVSLWWPFGVPSTTAPFLVLVCRCLYRVYY